MCYYPIKVKSVKGVVPCGQCLECLQSKRAQWTYRLYNHNKHAINSTFLTLTYNDDAVPLDDGKMVLDKVALQLFLKRVRKENPIPDMKYYAVGEYGEKSGRPHYHAIMFNVEKELCYQKWSVIEPGGMQSIPFGHVYFGDVSQASIHYVTKYVINKHNYAYKKRFRPFTLISNGIGLDHIEKSAEYYRKNPVWNITQEGGIIGKMPRYMADKIYDDEMKEIIKEETKQYFEFQKLETTYEQEMSRRRFVKQMYKRSKSQI